MNKYIARANIKHFTGLLGKPLDPKQREVVLRLLAEEENKLKILLETREVGLKEIKQ
jgi:hypothetical protein